MSESVIKINIPEWVEAAEADVETYRQRQVTEIILHAIANTPSLKKKALFERRDSHESGL